MWLLIHVVIAVKPCHYKGPLNRANRMNDSEVTMTDMEKLDETMAEHGGKRVYDSWVVLYNHKCRYEADILLNNSTS